MTTKKTEVEICCGDIESVSAARSGGAHRIELCCALSEGGLTPSLAMIRAAVASGIGSVNVLIRPRKGDFLYSPAERALIADDIAMAVDAGATGVVVGALTPDGDVDTEALGPWRQQAGDAEMVFHRAFDMCRDPREALETLIGHGCSRVLTSGLQPSAYAGMQMLKQIVQWADGRIVIMAGSGVTPANAAEIASTGVDAVHSTARSAVKSRMRFRRDDVNMGAADDEFSLLQTDPEVVKSLLNAVK